MRFTYECPKCTSSEVVKITGSNMNNLHKIPLTRWGGKSALIDRYICTNCGFTEEYIHLSDKLKKWLKEELKNQEGTKEDGDFV